MYHKNIFSGVIGQVLARGTWFLSLAKANLASPVMQNQRFSYPLIQPNKVRYLDMGACSIEMKSHFVKVIFGKDMQYQRKSV